VASFVGLTEVLFAVLFAWLLLGQTPGPLQLAGGVLVVAGIGLVRVDQGSDAERSDVAAGRIGRQVVAAMPSPNPKLA
jgi:drug/metabolite transporter (DMT)-like permease